MVILKQQSSQRITIIYTLLLKYLQKSDHEVSEEQREGLKEVVVVGIQGNGFDHTQETALVVDLDQVKVCTGHTVPQEEEDSPVHMQVLKDVGTQAEH